MGVHCGGAYKYPPRALHTALKRQAEFQALCSRTAQGLLRACCHRDNWGPQRLTERSCHMGASCTSLKDATIGVPSLCILGGILPPSDTMSRSSFSLGVGQCSITSFPRLCLHGTTDVRSVANSHSFIVSLARLGVFFLKLLLLQSC